MSEQIKETDIMIGNWFSYTNENGTFNLQVEEIRPTGIITTWNGGTWYVAYDRLKPIPLTEDILLKCGFKVSINKTCYGMITESGKTRLSIFHDGLFKVSCEDLEIKVKYLHQLQNLYKALTQTDLKV